MVVTSSRQRTRLVQERTGFQSWRDHMTCITVHAPVAAATRQLEALAAPQSFRASPDRAALELTWGDRGFIALRTTVTPPGETIRVSRPIPGVAPGTSAVWLEIPSESCKHSTLYEVSVALIRALADTAGEGAAGATRAGR